MAPVRTEPVKTENTNYNRTYGNDMAYKRNISMKERMRRPRTEKVNEIEFSMRNYNPPVRHFNREPDFEKKLKPQSFKMNYVKPELNEQIIKKQLHKAGVQPIKLKLEKNTISHQHKGTGMIVIEATNKTRVDKTLGVLKRMGVDTRPARNFNSIIKY
jgi:hypothetical protein